MEVQGRLPPHQYRCFVLCYQHDEETSDSFISRLYLQCREGPDLSLPDLITTM